MNDRKKLNLIDLVLHLRSDLIKSHEGILSNDLLQDFASKVSFISTNFIQRIFLEDTEVNTRTKLVNEYKKELKTYLGVEFHVEFNVRPVK